MNRNSATLHIAILALVGPVPFDDLNGGLVPTTPSELPEAVTDADFYDDGNPTPEKVELGRLLFFDKILSGNRNISCATCHHPDHGTSDGVALSFGEGASGLGPNRQPGQKKSEAVHGRIPRNSPALFNLGAREFTRLFHDGRVEADTHGYYEGGFITPAKWKLPSGLDSALAAQAMFPVTSPDEMAGQKGENPVADAVSLNRAAGPGGAWDLLAERLRAIPEYRKRFEDAFSPLKSMVPRISLLCMPPMPSQLLKAVAFRADNSAFDRYLRGEKNALQENAKRGMALFYGQARCVSCHSGKFQTDHGFHAIAMPQIGPGKADGKDPAYWRASGHRGFVEDFGRGRVTARSEDNYKFRTPSLRNVAVTGPWGHAGAYDSLEKVVRHHIDARNRLEQYEIPEDLLPPLPAVLELTASGSSLEHHWLNASRLKGFLMRDSWVVGQRALRQRIASANELQPVELSDSQVNDLISFLKGLTDPISRRSANLPPATSTQRIAGERLKESAWKAPVPDGIPLYRRSTLKRT